MTSPEPPRLKPLSPKFSTLPSDLHYSIAAHLLPSDLKNVSHVCRSVLYLYRDCSWSTAFVKSDPYRDYHAQQLSTSPYYKCRSLLTKHLLNPELIPEFVPRAKIKRLYLADQDLNTLVRLFSEPTSKSCKDDDTYNDNHNETHFDNHLPFKNLQKVILGLRVPHLQIARTLKKFVNHPFFKHHNSNGYYGSGGTLELDSHINTRLLIRGLDDDDVGLVFAQNPVYNNAVKGLYIQHSTTNRIHGRGGRREGEGGLNVLAQQQQPLKLSCPNIVHLELDADGASSTFIEEMVQSLGNLPLLRRVKVGILYGNNRTVAAVQYDGNGERNNDSRSSSTITIESRTWVSQDLTKLSPIPPHVEHVIIKLTKTKLSNQTNPLFLDPGNDPVTAQRVTEIQVQKPDKDIHKIFLHIKFPKILRFDMPFSLVMNHHPNINTNSFVQITNLSLEIGTPQKYIYTFLDFDLEKFPLLEHLYLNSNMEDPQTDGLGLGDAEEEEEEGEGEVGRIKKVAREFMTKLCHTNDAKARLAAVAMLQNIQQESSTSSVMPTETVHGADNNHNGVGNSSSSIRSYFIFKQLMTAAGLDAGNPRISQLLRVKGFQVADQVPLALGLFFRENILRSAHKHKNLKTLVLHVWNYYIPSPHLLDLVMAVDKNRNDTNDRSNDYDKGNKLEKVTLRHSLLPKSSWNAFEELPILNNFHVEKHVTATKCDCLCPQVVFTNNSSSSPTSNSSSISSNCSFSSHSSFSAAGYYRLWASSPVSRMRRESQWVFDLNSKRNEIAINGQNNEHVEFTKW